MWPTAANNCESYKSTGTSNSPGRACCFIYIYIYIYIYTYIHTYTIYMYIYRERDRQIDRKMYICIQLIYVIVHSIITFCVFTRSGLLCVGSGVCRLTLHGRRHRRRRRRQHLALHAEALGGLAQQRETNAGCPTRRELLACAQERPLCALLLHSGCVSMLGSRASGFDPNHFHQDGGRLSKRNQRSRSHGSIGMS